MDDKRAVGRMFVVGFDGEDAPEWVLEAAASGRIGGVILFRRNCRDPHQIADLCRRLKSASPEPFIVSIDHEGGPVLRLDEPFTRFPAMANLGRAGSPDLARRLGRAMATELGAVGIDVNFAPVLDVDSNPENPIIGERAIGSDPELVARLGIAFIEEMQAGGVVAAAKHFPGHGDTIEDSHHTLPFVDATDDILLARELVPFERAVRNGVGAVMSAHVLYPAFDTELPATLSRSIITGLLRERLGYDGLVVTDDLLMKGITDAHGPGQAALLAVEAGCDILLVCREQEFFETAFEEVLHAVRTGAVSKERVATSVRRIDALHERFGIGAAGKRQDSAAIDAVVGCPEHKELAEELTSFS